MSRGGIVEEYGYDSKGRMSRKTLRIGNATLTAKWQWNFDGQPSKLEYPWVAEPNRLLRRIQSFQWE